MRRRSERSAVVLGALLIVSMTAQGAAGATKVTCNLRSEGKAFLAAATGRGLEAEQKSDCHKVATADNTFYAKPATPCTLFFANGTWLAANARFSKVRGGGNFTARVLPTGFEVIIKPKGGFYLYQVTIAITGTFKTCAEVQLDDVLGGG